MGRVAAVSFNTKVLITIGSSPPAPVLDLYLLTFFKKEASRDWFKGEENQIEAA
jgi:hypothetical protein